MLPLLISFIAALAPPSGSTRVCDVGRATLRDLPPPSFNPADATYYVDADPNHPGLMAACPDLRKELPAGYSVADEAAWSRARVHAPVLGRCIAPTTIYLVGIPKVAADGRSATVEWGYECTGLCSGGFMSRYVRTPAGWRLDGRPRMKWVS